MSRKHESPKGYKCSCGHFMPFALYVYAHWNIELTATCERCGRKASVFAGSVLLLGKPRKARKKLAGKE